MAEENQNTEVVESKTWKQTVGAFLTKKGAIIGAALVVIGGVLEGSTSWVDGLVSILKSFFGA